MITDPTVTSDSDERHGLPVAERVFCNRFFMWGPLWCLFYPAYPPQWLVWQLKLPSRSLESISSLVNIVLPRTVDTAAGSSDCSQACTAIPHHKQPLFGIMMA